jgi:hypothetical protein
MEWLGFLVVAALVGLAAARLIRRRGLRLWVAIVVGAVVVLLLLFVILPLLWHLLPPTVLGVLLAAAMVWALVHFLHWGVRGILALAAILLVGFGLWTIVWPQVHHGNKPDVVATPTPSPAPSASSAPPPSGTATPTPTPKPGGEDTLPAGNLCDDGSPPDEVGNCPNNGVQPLAKSCDDKGGKPCVDPQLLGKLDESNKN